MLDRVLFAGLRLKRPHGGQGEDAYRRVIADALPAPSTVDAAGNLILDLGGGTVWTAHMDTVHRVDGPNRYRYAQGIISACDAPLGADDAAGCAALVELARRGVPGLYCWTVGEEVGGVGARALAGALPSGYLRAVAIDRRGRTDICGSQGGLTLASRAYVEALAEQLGMGHTYAHGVYTDNREFAGQVANIVNISAGYLDEHTDRESLDIRYLHRLVDRLALVDWDSLPAEGPEAEEMDAWGAWSVPSDDLQDIAERMARDFGGVLDPADLLPYLEDVYDLGAASRPAKRLTY